MPNTPSRETVLVLTEIHINRFKNRVRAGESGSTHINLPQCRMYLNIWESIKAKDYSWDKLEPKEQIEVLDALQDEAEY